MDMRDSVRGGGGRTTHGPGRCTRERIEQDLERWQARGGNTPGSDTSEDSADRDRMLAPPWQDLEDGWQP
eukprot:3380595-Alexandrium_andersonii.AAC.1